MCIAKGVRIPQNQKTANRDFDWLRRERDCFILNHAIPLIDDTGGIRIHSVRGVFQEGDTVFKGAGIKRKSHIQIAVRDPHAILGYFRPKGF